MLEIDDLKKLAKMLEVLLDRTQDNKEINLQKYKDVVMQIDNDAFEKLFTLLKQFESHNLTLEEELEFLEQVTTSYQQLLEQQIGFKNVYELHSDEDLILTDLKQINIDYINDRISNISGYLINKKNIDVNREKLQKLYNKYNEEELKKNDLNKRLLEYEEILRNSFINAEGRSINDGKLQYISVLSEYNALDIDFEDLLYDNKKLEKLLSLVNAEKIDTSEKLKIAEICYNNAPSIDSKQILDDINIEDLKVKYRLALLKIIELLSINYDDYENFKVKREQLADLIKYRFNCASKLGMSISIDPFSRTKVIEQLDFISAIQDNSKEINKIKKEITSLDQRLEDMVVQDKDYFTCISQREDLILSKTSINDIDISEIVLPPTEEIVSEIVVENQVVDVKDIPEKFNYSIVKQKTNRVIDRVNEMVNNTVIVEQKIDILSPELVIVPHHDIELDDINVDTVYNEDKDFNINTIDENLITNIDEDITKKEDLEENEDSFIDIPQETNVNNDDVIHLVDDNDELLTDDMFKIVDPFVEAPLFTDRTDNDDAKKENSDLFAENVENVINEELIISDNNNKDSSGDDKISDEMPDAFWITQSDTEDSLVENGDEYLLSFDEQIDALLSDDIENSKNKKSR